MVLSLTACVGAQPEELGHNDELERMLITSAEALGWDITPDDGPVDGKSGDCTGAAYDWPDTRTLDHASQFLDRPDETVAVLIRRVDGDASGEIEALRGALAPCAPSTGETLQHGAIITERGDDSFAYQTPGTDDRGNFLFTNMLISCADLLVEVLAQSYPQQLDQEGLEELISPVVQRVEVAGGCSE